jgi:hypothetical protein
MNLRARVQPRWPSYLARAYESAAPMQSGAVPAFTRGWRAPVSSWWPR